MTNVKLSTAEIELVCNGSIILTKNKIIERVCQMFGGLLANYQSKFGEKNLPKELIQISAKIAKGENYEGLPWVMLDYPRYFTKHDVFAIRTFFWWGNFCSITLQLKGNPRDFFNCNNFMKNNNEWFICCNEDEWQHHFKEDNFLPAKKFTKEQIEHLPFLKLAKKIPLHEWDNIENFMQTSYTEILDFLTT
jgi:hypothetical protein